MTYSIITYPIHMPEVILNTHHPDNGDPFHPDDGAKIDSILDADLEEMSSLLSADDLSLQTIPQCAPDGTSWEEFYNNHAHNAYRIALNIVHNHELAEQIVQDAFLIAARTTTFNSSKGEVTPWFKRVVKNRAIDYWRKQQRVGMISFDEMEGEKIFPTADDPEDEVAHRDYLLHLKIVISEIIIQLPEKYQTITRMAFLDGRSETEIASELNLPLGTVKTRRMKAKQLLAELLENNKDRI